MPPEPYPDKWRHDCGTPCCISSVSALTAEVLKSANLHLDAALLAHVWRHSRSIYAIQSMRFFIHTCTYMYVHNHCMLSASHSTSCLGVCLPYRRHEFKTIDSGTCHRSTFSRPYITLTLNVIPASLNQTVRLEISKYQIYRIIK